MLYKTKEWFKDLWSERGTRCMIVGIGLIAFAGWWSNGVTVRQSSFYLGGLQKKGAIEIKKDLGFSFVDTLAGANILDYKPGRGFERSVAYNRDPFLDALRTIGVALLGAGVAIPRARQKGKLS